MKLTKTKLKQIIKEEIGNLKEHVDITEQTEFSRRLAVIRAEMSMALNLVQRGVEVRSRDIEKIREFLEYVPLFQELTEQEEYPVLGAPSEGELA